MTKIAVICDTHFGYKNSSEIHLNYQREFFHNQFFPYCEKNGINRILHLGDIFDNRKHITVKALKFVRTEFLEEIQARGFTLDIIPGNHDVAFKNTNELCSMFEVLRYYNGKGVNVYMEPTVLDFDGFTIGLVPWITADNYDQCMDFIENSSCTFLAGHFEISGFKLIANSKMKSHGFKKEIFDRYDTVISGHYHTKSSQGNIIYLGSQYQFNWSDVDDKKYFHIIDTETREIEPVQNKNRIYTRFYYDDKDAKDVFDIVKGASYSKKNIKGKYIRIVVSNRTNYQLFDQYITLIKKMNPHDLTIIENFEEYSSVTEDDEKAAIEDTPSLIEDHIDTLEISLNKDRLKKLMRELYTEAMTDDSV